MASFPRVQIKRGCDKTETLFVHPKTRKEINDPPTKTLVFFFFFFSKTINQSFIKVVDLFSSSTVVRTNATRRESTRPRGKRRHTQKKNDSSRGGRVPAIFERVFSRAFLDDVLFAFFSFFFVLFWHLGDKSSLLKFFKARKKKEKKRGLWSPKSQNKSSLKKTRRSRKHNIGTRRDRL